MKSFAAAFFMTIVVIPLAHAMEPVREGQETMISRAVFAEGKLWLLSDAGQMFTVTQGKAGRENVALPEPAIELWLKNGEVSVVTCPDKSCKNWTLRQMQGGNWRTIANLASNKDEIFLATAEAEGATLLLTTARLIELKGSEISTVTIDNPRWAWPGRVTTVLARPGRVLVGTNAGEWGGTLAAIDRKTGHATEVCGSGGCGPVNGLVAEPGNPGCVLAAIGLVHFGPSGRILKMCGNTVKRFYFRNLPCVDLPEGRIDLGCMGQKPEADGEMPFHMEAFFGLIRSGDVAWGVGVDGLYKITAHGVERTGNLPNFTNYGGTRVSFEIPGVVMVLTEINERVSLSGAVPMLVPR